MIALVVLTRQRPGRRLADPRATCRTRSPASALLLLFAAAMLWLGHAARPARRARPTRCRASSSSSIFPLTFLSNAFVPATGLPDGLQPVAEWNPVSAMVAAVRTLFGNPTAAPADAAWPLQHPVLAAAGVVAVLLAAVVPADDRRASGRARRTRRARR